ncbi:MAG: hypothetical protein LM575_05910 [Caldimicrobium sp.]|nr:hypothetical protein [Caldimicrobium sp.]
MGLFGGGKKKKKAKKAKKAMKSAQELSAYIARLKTQAPKTPKDEMIKRLLKDLLPKVRGKVSEEYAKVFQPAEQAGVALASTVVGSPAETWKQFFAKRKEEAVERKMKELTPQYIENLSQFLGELYKPEVAVTYGLAKTAPQWLSREWYKARPQVEQQFADVQKSYASLVENIQNYLKEIGLEGIKAEDILGQIWSV